MHRKRILSLHPLEACEKGYFNRDFGQIGYTFQCEKGYDSEVWSLNKESYKSFIIKGQLRVGFKYKIQLYGSLLWKGNKFNLLHLYHISRDSFFSVILYRISNRLLLKRGIIYIKMDTPLFLLNKDYRKEIMKVNTILLNLFFSFVDFIGFENQVLLEFYQQTFTKYKHKFILTTNGAIEIKSFIGKITKKNSISLCGRFGAPEKNYELMIDMLANYNVDFLEGWHIYLIGSSTLEFLSKLDSLYIKKPELKKIILNIGFLNDKTEIYKILTQSKIFLHTSDYEGDPNIQYDAMFCGCYMVSTDVGNIRQNYLSNYCCFYPPKDLPSMYRKLKSAITLTESFNNSDYCNIQNHCINHFTWRESLKSLFDVLD